MYKDIVVWVNDSDGRENTIAAAMHFAIENNASLAGLYIRLNDIPATPPYGVVSDDISQLAKEREDERVAEAQADFERIAKELNCNDSTWLVVPEFDNPLKPIIYTDLVIANHASYEPLRGRSSIGFINSLILETGKPILLIPTRWNEQALGNRILIGWDESREATRALQDAMPLLKQADRVEALYVNYKDDNGVVDVSQISSYLARRNVENTFSLAITDEHFDTPEKVLLNHASKTSADLIVVGGYGHTRIREIVLGGVTRFLTKHSDMPVLFSH